jgi:nicotinate-nucleotide adenylyltransferase
MLRRLTGRVKKIGILSGSFDPVHAGHIGLALAAKEAVGLDEVYLAPEVRPRRKAGVTHIAHRLAMLELAVKPHSGLGVLELNDRNFTPAKILPKLQARFPGSQLYFICGEDMLTHMPSWPLIDRMLEEMTLVVGRRHRETGALDGHSKLTAGLNFETVDLNYPDVSSSAIREALMAGGHPKGLLKTTEAYIKQHWLYSSLTG